MGIVFLSKLFERELLFDIVVVINFSIQDELRLSKIRIKSKKKKIFVRRRLELDKRRTLVFRIFSVGEEVFQKFHFTTKSRQILINRFLIYTKLSTSYFCDFPSLLPVINLTLQTDNRTHFFITSRTQRRLLFIIIIFKFRFNVLFSIKGVLEFCKQSEKLFGRRNLPAGRIGMSSRSAGRIAKTTASRATDITCTIQLAGN